MRNVWIIGGDARQRELARLLEEDGHCVHVFGLDSAGLPEEIDRESDLRELHRADCVVLPLPLLDADGAINTPLWDETLMPEALLEASRPGQLVCGGRITPGASALAESRGILLRDYFEREELTVANAALTAEGAVRVALEEMKIALQRARALVLGFGRVGKLTAHRMAALGASVTVAARKYADLAWAEAYGHRAARIDELEDCLCGYDLVVNTVPALVLDRAKLEALKEGCLVIDLASKPGGVDFEGAKELGVKCVWALALPGKTAPVSAAGALRDTLYNMLREFG